MKHKVFLSFLFVAPLLLAGCDGSFGSSGGKASRKGENIVNEKEWDSVFEPENFSMHTNFSHKVVQTMKGKDGKEIERCSEDMQMDSGKIHVIQKYRNIGLDGEGNIIENGDDVYTLDMYVNVLKVEDNGDAEYNYYRQQDGKWYEFNNKENLKVLYLELALFEFPFDEFEYNSATNSYYSKQYTYQMKNDYHTLKEIQIRDCTVKFKDKQPVSYVFDFTSINSDGSENLTAHMDGEFGDYNKIKVELPQAEEAVPQS